MSNGLTGCYVNLAEEVLNTMETDVLNQLSLVRQGKTFNSVTMGGKTVQKSLASMEELKTELAEIKFALRKLDPDTYGLTRRNFTPDFRSRTR